MADQFELVDVDFGPSVEAEIEKYVRDMLELRIAQHQDLHRNLIPKWRRLYLGVPAEMTRNFPFPNAANTVVQVIGETTDTMVARVMGLIAATHPLWPYKNYVAGDEKAIKEAEDKKRVLEDFMDNVGMDPFVLNLQPIESLWYTDACKLGTSFLKINIEEQVEAVVVGYESDAKKKIKANELTKFEGPRVSKLRHEDVLVDPTVTNLTDDNFIAVRRTLKRFDLEERGFTGAYDAKKVEAIMGNPDRHQAAPQTQEELQAQGVSTAPRPEVSAEWDIYECHFSWWHNKRKFWLVYSYHLKSRTVLRKVFNFLPNNERPLIKAKLGHRTDGAYGHGYSELLEYYQEEISTTHNQRLDNATVANIRALRVSPKARALDASMELYPGALLVGEKDEIEALAVGDVYPSTFKDEELTLGLVARRAGISPAISGSGTGGMMKKPAVYSAQGTLAVMQENNSVVGHATSEFRNAHVQLGSTLTAIYGKFGTYGMEEMFGIEAPKLKAALSEFAAQRMRIPIRAATGSLNKEVDKQAGMIMSGVIQRHYTAVGQLLQAIANPVIPPEVRDYFVHTVMALTRLHKRIVKDFGYEQPDLYITEPQLQEQRGGQAQGAGGQGGMAPQGSLASGGGAAGPGGGPSLPPVPGMGGPQGGPVPPSGAGGPR